MLKVRLLILFATYFTDSYTQTLLTNHTFKYDSTVAFKAKIEEVNWLTGKWTGRGFGGILEEIWSAPKSGTMVATFSMYENKAPVFFEFCMIAEANHSLVYKVKHFNPDLTGWEEKNDYTTFHLVKLDEKAIYFEGFTMINHIDSCEIYLALKQKDGSFVEEKLMYYRDGVSNKSNNKSLDPETILRRKAIDHDVWLPFIDAYKNLDITKYLSLHTEDFIRATGGQNGSLRNKKEYSTSVQSQFTENKNNKQNIAIAFSFFERNANETTASERGIYRYSITHDNGETQHFYGKFHVFLRKINGIWKIVVDYDSDEDGTIGEEDFEKGDLEWKE